MAEVIQARSGLDYPEQDPFILQQDREYELARLLQRQQVAERLEARVKEEKAKKTIETAEQIQEIGTDIRKIVDICAAIPTFGLSYFLKANVVLIFCNGLHFNLPLIGPKPLSQAETIIILAMDFVIISLIILVIVLISLADPGNLAKMLGDYLWGLVKDPVCKIVDCTKEAASAGGS